MQLIHNSLKQLCEDLNCTIEHESPPHNTAYWNVYFEDEKVCIHDFETLAEVEKYLEGQKAMKG